jgi:mycothiol synthase
MTQNNSFVQLQMIWPRHRLGVAPDVPVAAGYGVRTYRPGDEARFYQVMDMSGFQAWNDEELKPWLAKILPDGWFFVVHQASNQIVATSMTTHNPTDLHPFGGELSWVASDPSHKGQGVGLAVCAAVTARFIAAGYRNIYLKTDDWRLPAIKTYLKLGYVPFLFTPEMEERWHKLCTQLDWPFTPEAWPQRRDYHHPEEQSE